MEINRYITDRTKQFFYLADERIDAGSREILKKKFRSMPYINELSHFLEEWFDDSPYLVVNTSGSTGKPKPISVNKEMMMHSALNTCRTLGLSAGDTALLCMPLDYIAGKMMVVRALVASLKLVICQPDGHPLANITEPLRFAAMIPLQIYNSMQNESENRQLQQIDIVIIGGGAIDEQMETRLHNYPNRIYSTYGMTETLSHIALRRINGEKASRSYHPFPSVRLFLSEEGTLVIDAPDVCEKRLYTNDIAELHPDGSFTIIGRKDNIINSGGIKLQTEKLEEEIRTFLTIPFAVTAVPDPKFGEKVVLLLEKNNLPITTPEIEKLIEKHLNKYHRPKQILITDKIPLTETGKISRNECRQLARSLIK